MTETQNPTPNYNDGDQAYKALGELDGITRLVNRFYELMDSEPHARELRDMHPADLTGARNKLVAFISGWSGGPALYAERYGGRSLAMTHKHFIIDNDTTRSWLDCMQQALADMGYEPALQEYMNSKFYGPAQSIQMMSEFEQNRPVMKGSYHDPL
ncbi:group II truncated hemoglobin [Oceanobacter mangrovi]|uniref:group II truncated hemoglobin n=1 Tax=Oceanobacter mangrovi TaxID=2862510 RepID=UPI001C8E49A3|nr:group II truncated hemoglobin [Oceanobacter mangrovi]